MFEVIHQNNLTLEKIFVFILDTISFIYISSAFFPHAFWFCKFYYTHPWIIKT